MKKSKTKIMKSKMEFLEKHGSNLPKETFFKKYLDNSLFYIFANFAMWIGIAVLTSKCSS